jgi:alkanesulfonate monooxygenase SsuD/methylene tetrahydromethanopterin reductase-like flavin-dependent oxidoreductase (luciferase family)
MRSVSVAPGSCLVRLRFGRGWATRLPAARGRDCRLGVEDIVAAGGAIIGSPATVLERMNFYADAGVDEVMCFMQGYTTKHDDIMRSIRLVGEEVIPKVKPTAVVI